MIEGGQLAPHHLRSGYRLRPAASNRRSRARRTAEEMGMRLLLSQDTSIDVVPDLVAASPTTRILILTMHEDPAFDRAALRVGAAGYLLKERGQKTSSQQRTRSRRGARTSDGGDA
jgi:DNA-binding NarL/FixJ family response regulator